MPANAFPPIPSLQRQRRSDKNWRRQRTKQGDQQQQQQQQPLQRPGKLCPVKFFATFIIGQQQRQQPVEKGKLEKCINKQKNVLFSSICCATQRVSHLQEQV